MSLFALPETRTARKQVYNEMGTETRQLIDKLFGNESKYLSSAKRIKPLEDYIVRYSKIMAFVPECINMLTELGVTTYGGDPRVDLYYVLKERVDQTDTGR